MSSESIFQAYELIKEKNIAELDSRAKLLRHKRSSEDKHEQ